VEKKKKKKKKKKKRDDDDDDGEVEQQSGGVFYCFPLPHRRGRGRAAKIMASSTTRACPTQARIGEREAEGVAAPNCVPTQTRFFSASLSQNRALSRLTWAPS
jgi:hypothetical protein